MIEEDDSEKRTGYEGWKLPGGETTDGSDGSEMGSESEEDWGPPPTMRDPILRDRIRDRLGLTPRQWYVLEAFLIALPYPFFVAGYMLFPVNETLFLVVTLVYSLVAMYVGFMS